MKLHPTLHKALLAGVTRVPLDGALGGAPQIDALLDGATDASLLWQMLGANALWQRAGYQPVDLPAAPAGAAPDDNGCPRAAEASLQMLLRGIHPQLLGNWLMLAHAHRCRLPHSCLVALLDMGMHKPALRATLAPLLDQRGRWLVAQHPGWAARYAIAADDAADWQLGNPGTRCLALQAMRRADPAGALAALERDWAQEPPENRVALLPTLATGLSLADEPFLERVLDDKRKEVRAAAQALLAGLAGAQLQQRCGARLAAIFTLERKSGLVARLASALSGADALPTLAVSLPDACDKAMKRDGIGLQTHWGIGGEKAGWLADLMRCVPPPHWCAQWRLTPSEVIAVVLAQEFGSALLNGLTHAVRAMLRADASETAIDWYLALIDVNNSARIKFDIGELLLPELASLPKVQQQRVLQIWIGQIAHNRHAYQHMINWAQQCMDNAGAPWTAALSQRMLGYTQAFMQDDARPNGAAHANFAVLANCLDVADLAYAQANWPPPDWPHWPLWQKEVDTLMDTLRFRHTMQRSFLEKDA